MPPPYLYFWLDVQILNCLYFLWLKCVDEYMLTDSSHTPSWHPEELPAFVLPNMDSQETFAWAEEMKFPTSKMTTWVKIYPNVLGPSAFCSFFFFFWRGFIGVRAATGESENQQQNPLFCLLRE